MGIRALIVIALSSVALAAMPSPAGAHGALVTRPHARRPLGDRKAARLVRRSRAESRPANTAATHRMPTAAELRLFRARSDMPYARFVTGHFTGTTDEVLQWAAIKWGLRPDLLRAV